MRESRRNAEQDVRCRAGAASRSPAGRWLAMATFLIGTLGGGAGSAQTLPTTDAEVFALAREACSDPVRTALCALLSEQIADFAAQSLLVVGASGQRAAAIEAVRDFAGWPQPIVRYAAATAIGGLFPAVEDTALLAALANDPVPAVRVAALGSLRVSSDPRARQLVERARSSQGTAMVPDGPLIDPAALPVGLPDGAEPVRFTPDREEGIAAWIVDAPRAAVLAELEAKVGAQAIDLDALAALYDPSAPAVDLNDPMAVMQYMLELEQRIDQLPEDQQEAAYLAAMMELAAAQSSVETDGGAADRWRDAGRYGAPMAVVLPADPVLPMPFPTRIALVYDDLALGRTGFALQWVAPAVMPPEPEPEPEQPGTAATPGIFGLQSTREDATPDLFAVEERVWEAVLLSEDPEAARLFIDAFPDSAHAGEAARLRDGWLAAVEQPAAPGQSSLFGQPAEPGVGTPTLAVDAAILVDNAPIVVRYAGLETATGRDPWIAVSFAGTDDAGWGDWAWASGDEGSVSLPHQRAGDYELRLYVEHPRREVIARLPITVTPAAGSDSPLLEAEAADYAVGEAIGVRWSGLPGTRSDWITVVPAGAPDTEWGSWAYTDGGTSGRLVLTGPDTPGAYEIRAYLESPREVVARIPITVTP